MSNDSEFTPPAASLPDDSLLDSSRSDNPVMPRTPAPEPAAEAASLSPANGPFGDSSSGDLSSGESSSGESWVRPVLEPGPIAFPPRSPLGAPPTSGESSAGSFSTPPAAPPIPRRARQIPNLGHTLLLLILAAITLIVTEIAVFAVVMATHLFGNETPQQLLREPRLLIPCMAISYLIIVALAWPLFARLWRQPFPLGIRWNAAVVRRRGYLFLGIGVALSVCVQFLSNYLPIPKTLPIDDFFRTPADLWLVAAFGVFLAPACEELAFRGFLLPSLASAWDRMAQRGNGQKPGGMGRDLSQWAREMKSGGVSEPPEPGGGGQLYDSSTYLPAVAAPGPLPDLRPASVSYSPCGPLPDPKWSAHALIFSSILTSIGFALLHADQLAHSWAPLAVLFTVSLVLCVVRLRTHSLAASALVHAAYNGTIFALIFYATDGFRHLDKLTR